MTTTHNVEIERSGAHWKLSCPCTMTWPDAISEQQAQEWKDRHEERFQPSRPDWDSYFLGIAYAVSTRADCTRAKHGAVIVKDHRVVSTGYNGGPAGGPSCLKGECPRGRLSYDELPPLAGYDDPHSPGFCHAIHAEANALIYANRADCVGAVIYITGQPCEGCKKLIAAAGIVDIVYAESR